MTRRERERAAQKERAAQPRQAANRERDTGREEAAERMLTDGEVAEYLRAHPDFFERRPDALHGLELHHQSGRATVSLVQRQVAMLRRRNEELRDQFKDIVDVAKDNHALVEKIHQLAISLMAEVDTEQRVHVLRTRLREDFGVERAVLILFAAPCAVPARDRFIRIIDPGDAGLKSFASFRKSDEPLCVRLRPAQKRLAFGDAEADVQSAALIPLGSHAEHGFIVVASRDPDHFHPGKRADYLRRLGEIVSTALLADRGTADAAGGSKASGS